MLMSFRVFKASAFFLLYGSSCIVKEVNRGCRTRLACMQNYWRVSRPSSRCARELFSEVSWEKNRWVDSKRPPRFYCLVEK